MVVVVEDFAQETASDGVCGRSGRGGAPRVRLGSLDPGSRHESRQELPEHLRPADYQPSRRYRLPSMAKSNREWLRSSRGRAPLAKTLVVVKAADEFSP